MGHGEHAADTTRAQVFPPSSRPGILPSGRNGGDDPSSPHRLEPQWRSYLQRPEVRTRRALDARIHRGHARHIHGRGRLDCGSPSRIAGAVRRGSTISQCRATSSCGAGAYASETGLEELGSSRACVLNDRSNRTDRLDVEERAFSEVDLELVFEREQEAQRAEGVPASLDGM